MIESKSCRSAVSNAAASEGGSCTVSLAPHATVFKISHKHQHRLSGIGPDHGHSTRHVWPMASMPAANAVDHHSCGSAAEACWLTTRQSNHT